MKLVSNHDAVYWNDSPWNLSANIIVMFPYLMFPLCCRLFLSWPLSCFMVKQKTLFFHQQCLNRWWTLTCCVSAREPGFPGFPVHPTLALMMVGLGSKMPCIFLKAGMTKRLQVTTADTGFPRTNGRTERGRNRREEGEKYMSDTSSETVDWISLSLNFTHYLGGQRLVCEHRPCPWWQMLLVNWKRKRNMWLSLI